MTRHISIALTCVLLLPPTLYHLRGGYNGLPSASHTRRLQGDLKTEAGTDARKRGRAPRMNRFGGNAQSQSPYLEYVNGKPDP